MEPTERYEELCEGAAQSSKGFLDRRARRKHAAGAVSHLIAEYLGMPNGDATVVEVDGNLRSKGEKRPLGSDINLQRGDDGFWYFGLDLHFERPAASHFGGVTLYIGVDVVDGGVVVKHEKKHRVPQLTKENLEPFMQEVYEDLLDNYSRPPSKRRNSIGFVNEG
jgi:hypothetical protein